MLSSEESFNFIKSKIQTIGSALFTDLSSEYFKFPTCIVTALRVDEWGGIWFLMNKYGRKLIESDLEFPAKLSFYRKGCPYSLLVQGKAEVFNDPLLVAKIAGLQNNELGEGPRNIFLVKLRMLKSEYHAMENDFSGSILKKWWRSILEFIHPSEAFSHISFNLMNGYEVVAARN